MFISRVISRNFTRSSWCQAYSHQVKAENSGTDEKKQKNNVYFHDALKISYKRLQLEDKQLNQLISLVKSRKKLKHDQQIIVEGNQLIEEAVQSHLKLNHLIFSHIDKIENVVKIMGNSTSHINFLKVPQQDLSFYSVLTSCPGLIGIFEKPARIQPKANALPITVICDNLREPNNVGAVIRLANALPATKVLLPKGCADQWETKAIRGSSGSVFHMPTEDSVTWDMLEEKIKPSNDSIVLIADNNISGYHPSEVTPYDCIPDDLIRNKKIFIILGGESHGIGEEAKNFAMKRRASVVHIPLDPTVNSLNTSNALAIILFELRRKLM